jgi:hypothetical protein
MRTTKQILQELEELRDQLPESITIEELLSKAQDQENADMKKDEGRKQVGATIDAELWQWLRAQAIMEGRPAKYLLDDAIKEYRKKVEAEKGQASGQEE